MSKKTATAQAKGSPINGVVPPIERRFGQPNGNPRNPSGWKKSDTLRYKWEQMLKLDDEELEAVRDNPKASRVERMTAEVLLSKEMKPSEKISILSQLSNQVYGMPKQEIKQTNIEVPAPRLAKNRNEASK